MNVTDGGNEENKSRLATGPLFESLHSGHEHTIEHLLLHAADAGINIGDAFERMVVFSDAEAKLLIELDLGTMSLQIAEFGKRRGPFGDRVALDLLEIPLGFAGEVIPKQFVR